LISTLSLIKAGYVPVIISPRNSPAAIANFIKKGEISHFILGKEPVFEKIFRSSLDILHQEVPGRSDPTTSTFFGYEDFLQVIDDIQAAPYCKLNPDDLYCYYHSSGRS
jgi:hypothetical protein